MADNNNKYLDLKGLGYTIRKINTKKANLESPDFSGTPTVDGNDIVTTANIEEILGNKIEEIQEDKFVLKHGDALIDGTLTVEGTKSPILTLTNPNGSKNGTYVMNIQGNVMYGDCTSNDPARQYYGRLVPVLNQAIVGAVAIGYNPKDSSNYQKSTDYGIKFDVDVANSTSPTPTIIRQCGSFFVGAQGAYVGYSGTTTKAIDYNTQVYKVIDSSNISQDEYIKSLEARIAALEALITQENS